MVQASIFHVLGCSFPLKSLHRWARFQVVFRASNCNCGSRGNHSHYLFTSFFPLVVRWVRGGIAMFKWWDVAVHQLTSSISIGIYHWVSAILELYLRGQRCQRRWVGGFSRRSVAFPADKRGSARLYFWLSPSLIEINICVFWLQRYCFCLLVVLSLVSWITFDLFCLELQYLHGKSCVLRWWMYFLASP